MMQRTSTGIRLLQARTTFSPKLYEVESVELNHAPGQIDIVKWKAGAFQTLSNSGDTNAKVFETRIGGSSSACIERQQNDQSVSVIVLMQDFKQSHSRVLWK